TQTRRRHAHEPTVRMTTRNMVAVRVRGHGEMTLLVVSVTLLAVGAVLYSAGFDGAANGVWVADTLLGLVPAGWWVIDAARRRRMGVDALALLALLGTLFVGEYLAGA